LTLVAIYCTVLLFNISGTPTAILRLYGRYHSAAYGPIGNALLPVGLCYLVIRNVPGLDFFLFFCIATHILVSLPFLFFCFLSLLSTAFLVFPFLFPFFCS